MQATSKFVYEHSLAAAVVAASGGCSRADVGVAAIAKDETELSEEVSDCLRNTATASIIMAVSSEAVASTAATTVVEAYTKRDCSLGYDLSSLTKVFLWWLQHLLVGYPGS